MVKIIFLALYLIRDVFSQWLTDMTRVHVLDPSFLLTQSEKDVVQEYENEKVNDFKIKWTNLEYIYKLPLSSLIKKKILAPSDPVNRYSYILKGINGSVGRGKLVAVMGPSGSGKSTFLETLIGRRPTEGIKGQITCESKSKLRISFIPQSNQFFEQLTVKETITMAYNLFRATEETVNDGKQKPQIGPDMITEMVKQLSLEKCFNNPINQCSGGQLKRLAIASELIKTTDLLVMDEPTSGLDSASTLSLIQMLAKIKQQRNVSIMLTIHQPSFRVFSSFDTIYALSCEGKCLYNGPPNHVLPFLAHHGFNCPKKYNPADFVIDVASGNFGMDGLENLYREFKPIENESLNGDNNSKDETNLEGKKTLLEMIQYDDHPFIPHFLILMKRSTFVTVKNPWLFGLRLASHIIFAILIGIQMSPKMINSGGCPAFQRPQVSARLVDSGYLDDGSGNNEVTTLDTLSDVTEAVIEDGFGESEREFDPSTLEMIQENNRSQEDAIFDMAGVVFLSLLAMQFGAILPTILTMPLDVRTVMKETKNDWYTVSSYYWAKVVADVPFQLLFPVVHCGILFLFAWFGQDDVLRGETVAASSSDVIFRYSMLTLVSVVFVLTAQSHGVLVGVIFIQSPTVSAYIGTVSMIPFILLSGFLIRVQKMIVVIQILTYGSYLRYAYELSLIALYDWSRCSGGVKLGGGASGQATSEEIEKSFLESRQLMHDWLHDKFDAGEDGGTGVSDYWVLKLTELIVGDIVSSDGEFKPAILQAFGVRGRLFTPFLLILALQAVIFRVVTYLILKTKIKVQ